MSLHWRTTAAFDLRWYVLPLPITPQSVSLCGPATLPSSSPPPPLISSRGPGGRGCVRLRSVSGEDEGREVFTWKVVSSALNNDSSEFIVRSVETG